MIYITFDSYLDEGLDYSQSIGELGLEWHVALALALWRGIV